MHKKTLASIGIYLSSVVFGLGLSTLTSDVEVLEIYQSQFLWIGGFSLLCSVITHDS